MDSPTPEKSIADQLRNAARNVTTTEALAKTTLYWLAALEIDRLNAKLDRLDRDLERWQRQAYNQGAQDGYIDRAREDRDRG